METKVCEPNRCDTSDSLYNVRRLVSECLVFTHADGRRVSICVRVRDSFCDSVRTTKPKRLKLKPPNLA